MSPEPEVMVRELVVRVKLPPRVMAPEPLAARVMLPPVAETLPLIAMPPLFRVDRLNPPVVDEALRLTLLASLMNAAPLVFAERAVTSV